MTPTEHYQHKVKEGGLTPDPLQEMILQKLDVIYHALISESKKRNTLLSALRKPKVVKGLYLWGGVGIGKTFLMDSFFLSLPIKNKMRMHFHQFMHMIHIKLKKMQGKKNPLDRIAKALSEQAMVLCFDEFFVNDITDAMILANLLDALFKQGVTLVMTSNIEPDSLYYRGLQRQQFLPAIELIKKHCEVVHLASHTDYRRRYLKDAGVFYFPCNAIAQKKMEKTFAMLTNDLHPNQDVIIVCNRPIKIKKQVGDIAWFDFNELCNIPRSQNDYLAIADEFHTVFISNVPVIPAYDRNSVILFIKMVDVFYDAHIRIVVSAAAPIAELYPKGALLFEFQRTCSRLIEMQSEKYYAQH